MRNRSFFSLSLLILAFIALPAGAMAQDIHACVVIPPKVKTGRFAPDPTHDLPGVIVQKAVALGRPNTSHSNSNFWPIGGTLRVRFLGGSGNDHQRVARYAREWTQYANVNFAFVTSGPSDIRVSFTQNGSSWSMLGRQARLAPADRATMNFGWLNDRTPDYEFRRTVLHEFGHALGLLHEHQNPAGGIPWNEEAVYAFYLRTNGWDRRTTHHNVIARQHENETQYSAYDPMSIMHYPVDPRLTTGGYEVGLNKAISPTDAQFIARIYPGRNASPPVAAPTNPKPRQPVVSRPATRTNSQDREPAAGTHEITISNTLGKNQRAEIIELFLNDRKYVFNLRAGQRDQHTVRLKLKSGVYDYRINTSSVFVGLKRVWDGQRYVERRQNQQINGDGRGRIRIDGSGQLAFYGEYDRERRRMRIRLGKSPRTAR